MRKDIKINLFMLVFPLVVAIVGSMYPLFKDDDSESVKIRYDFEQIITTLENFHSAVGRYPTKLEGIGSLLGEIDIKGWSGPYLKKQSSIDPWKVPYFFKIEHHTILLGSLGPNKVLESNVEGVSLSHLNGDDIFEVFNPKNARIKGTPY